MITCRKAAELSSRELDAGLSLPTRLAFGLHRALCGKCRAFRAQLTCVNAAMAEYVGGDARPGVAGLPDDTKERIRAKLREEVRAE